MKKLFLVLILAVSASSIAQSVAKEDVEIIQSVYGKSKADLVKNYMGLSGAQAAGFLQYMINMKLNAKFWERRKFRLLMIMQIIIQI